MNAVTQALELKQHISLHSLYNRMKGRLVIHSNSQAKHHKAKIQQEKAFPDKDAALLGLFAKNIRDRESPKAEKVGNGFHQRKSTSGKSL